VERSNTPGGDKPTAQSRTREARRDLHSAIFNLHEVLDALETVDDLDWDFLMVGAAALFQNAADRFSQIAYNVEVYGRPTPAPVPLHRAPSVERGG